jgi:hypothetical protein
LTGIAGEVAPQRQGTFEGLHGVLSGLIARADDKTAEQRDATRARQANELGASEKEPHLIRNTLLLGGVALVAAGIIYTQKDRILTAVRSKYDTLRENTGGIYARGQKLGNTVMAALSVTASFFQKSMEKAQAFHKGQTKSDKKKVQNKNVSNIHFASKAVLPRDLCTVKIVISWTTKEDFTRYLMVLVVRQMQRGHLVQHVMH